MHPSLYIFLFQWCSGTSPLETWTSTKSLLSVPDCLWQCFPGAPRPGLRRAGANSWITVRSSSVNEVCLPISWWWVRLLPTPLSFGVGSHISLKDTFVCGWMPNFCCWGTKPRDVLCHHGGYVLSVAIEGPLGLWVVVVVGAVVEVVGLPP